MDPFFTGTIVLILFVGSVVAWIMIEGKKIKWYNVLIATVSGIMFSLIYSELSVGNTWYRNTGPNGEMQVSLYGMLKVLFEPLNPRAVWLWSPEWWLNNLFIVTTIILIPLTYIPQH
jgi:hypothetical protein